MISDAVLDIFEIDEINHPHLYQCKKIMEVLDDIIS